MRVAAPALLAAVLLCAAPVHARDVALTWNAPAGCPTRQAVDEEVTRLRGGSSADGEPLETDVDVEQLPDGTWEATIASADDAESRKLTGQTCATVANASAVVIAMMVDPIGALPDPQPQPEPATPRPEQQSEKPQQPEPRRTALKKNLPKKRAPPPTAEERSKFLIGAHFAGNVNALPSVASYGFGADVGGIIGPIRLDVGFTLYPPATAEYDAPAGAQIEVDLIAAHAAIAYVLVADPLELGPQLGIQIGSMSAVSSGVADPGSDGSAWIEPYAAILGAIVVAEWFAVPFRAGLGWAAIRPKFSTPPLGIAWEVDGVVGEVALGTEFRF